jgi:hypothetical protein
MAGLTETTITSTIVISYSRNDREYVVRLAKYLTDSGLRCWFDHDMVRGESFPQAIAQEIERCAALIVVMTPSAANSRWVTNEIVYAQQLGKTILPLLLEGRPLISVAALDYEDVRGGVMPGEPLMLRLKSLAGVTSTTRPTATETSATGASATRPPVEPGHRTTATALEQDRPATVTPEPVTDEIPLPVLPKQPTTSASQPAPPLRGPDDGKPPGPRPARSPKPSVPSTAAKKRIRGAAVMALALMPQPKRSAGTPPAPGQRGVSPRSSSWRAFC